LLNYSGALPAGTDASITNAYSDGWDVTNHTVNHNIFAITDGSAPAMTQAQINYVVSAQRDYQLANGWVRGSEFIGPAQDTNTYAQEVQMAKMGFKCLRGYRGLSIPTQFGHDNIYAVKDFGLDSTYGSYTPMLSNWETMITAFMNYGCDVWLVYHIMTLGNGGDPTGNTPTGVSNAIYQNSFNLLCAWLAQQQAAGNCVVCTPTEWLYGLK
jgi:hypothetical protein